MTLEEMTMATQTTVLFPWREAYSVHIEIIDSQHKVLVDTFNELHTAIVTGLSREHLGKILSSLIKYAQDHFKTEERLMLANQYPDLPNHKAKHETFTKTVLEFESKFKKNQVGLTGEVMDFLRDWFMNHIMGVDQKYAPYLNAKGIH